MQPILDWIRANPALFTAVVWPAFTGLLSLVYRKLDSDTRLHNFFGLLVSWGLNVPAGLEYLRRWLQGPSDPGKMGGGHHAKRSIPPDECDDAPPTTRGGRMMRTRLGLLLAGLLLIVGCILGKPSVIGPEVQLAECVTANAIAHKSLAQIAIACNADMLAVIEALANSEDAKVVASPAAGEARHVKFALGAAK